MTGITVAGQGRAAAGLTLGRPVSIDETVASPPGPFPKMAMARMDAATPIAAGEQTVTVSMTVSLAIDG